MALSQVTGLVHEPFRVVFRAPVRFGRERIADRVVGIVRVTDGQGRTGLGEAPTAADAAAVELVRSRVVGRTPAELVDAGGAWSMGDVAAGLAAATDAALLDLAARQADVAAATLLGAGPSRTDVAVNALLVATDDPAAGAAAARAAIRDGYACLKVKLEGAEAGSVPGWWTAALEAIRDSVGDRVALRLDLNGTLTMDAALGWLPGIAGLGVEYVEQPVAPADGPAALARLRSTGVAIAADESVTDAAAATMLLDHGSCDALVVKPGRVGGPFAAMAIVRAATLRGVPVTISTLYDTRVGLATALHVAAAVPGERAHGLGTAGLLAADPARGLPPVRQGRMEVRGPGLGVTRGSRAVAGVPA